VLGMDATIDDAIMRAETTDYISTYLGLDLKSALLVVIDECFHGFLFVVGYAVEDFAPHLRFFQHSLQTG